MDVMNDGDVLKTMDSFDFFCLLSGLEELKYPTYYRKVFF